MLKLPTVSGQEVVKALSKIGFKFRRQVGTHIIIEIKKRIPKFVDMTKMPAAERAERYMLGNR